QAGNNLTLESGSSIAAGNNSAENSHTIYLSAGDTSLTTGADFQLAPPHITLDKPLTGNLLIEGQLTTAGGDISLSATGNSSRATTGLVTVRSEIITRGGDISIVNSGNFTNSGAGNYTLNTSSTSGAGDISIVSGGDISLQSFAIDYGYPSSYPTKSGSVTAFAGGDFELTDNFNFNRTGPRRENGTSHGHNDQPFLDFSANGSLTINGEISDSEANARDALKVTLTADKDQTGG